MAKKAINELFKTTFHDNSCSMSQIGKGFKILWIIPQKILRWVLVAFALCLSGSVLVMTFWPAVRDDNRRIAMATIVTVVLLHALLAVGCLAYFFDAPELEVLSLTTVLPPNRTTEVTKAQ